ncbi:MAG: molybdopterin-dependent oxidoreductase, partial [Chloroflexota bacterium]|nr:molybdopterin-dependent oxidoreductase [Chloroflexota bacterium]
MTKYSVVGTSVPRVDALEKVTGRVKFCSDVRMHGMLYGKVLRSPHAHARIVSIDTSKAAALPGVRAVITGKDVPAKRCGAMRYAFDQHVLARGEVLYVGEGVAAVAADTLEIAERAVELIEVNYEELPAVFDVVEAWGTSPPAVLHPDLPSYEQAVPTVRLELDRPNVCNHYRVRHGDVEKGFREADLIMENRFTTARMQQVAFEPHTCIASWEVDGSLTVWSG